MESSASPSTPRFLLDENVKRKLGSFLASRGFDVRLGKGLSNGALAEISKSEKRVLVTNDADFARPELFSADRVFSVILLRVPQDKTEELMDAFSKLLSGFKEFEGHLIVLTEEKFEVSPFRST